MRAVVRREAAANAARAATSVGRLRVDPKTHVASVDGDALDLTPTEFRLLAALVARPGEVLERRALLRAGWPEERDPERVLRDVLQGKVSAERARDIYKVAIADRRIDHTTTKALPE
mgnify:CR=1 FL=1